jgi:hypothetical protein
MARKSCASADAGMENQLITSGTAESASDAAASIASAPEDSTQSAAADTALVSGPDGDYVTSDADVVSRLSVLLSPSGESTGAGEASGSGESCYTVSLPGGHSVGVTIDGDRLLCQDIDGGDWFFASGSAADFLAVVDEMSPKK